jgi:serine-type D-Ala-D-Ala carboxypeptidase/endopeptidase
MHLKPCRSARAFVRAAAVVICSATLLPGCGGGSDTAPPPPSPWSTVDQIAAAAFAGSSGISGMTLAVYDRNDQRVFVKNYGDFAPDRRVPVASASKLVAGTLILQAVGQGLLTLDSTTAQVLGWTGARGTITLRHLLSFTSGLTPEAACVLNPLVTLANCVDAIRDDPDAHPYAPGTRFDYGSTHLHVAARMVEVATGTAWNARFAQSLRTPLGLPAAVTYYTLPQQAVGQANPFVAGGLWASVDDYAPILAISFHRGAYRGVTWAPAALFDAQAIEPYPGVTIGNSPAADMGVPFRYGLTAWLECATPATGCSTFSSTGAFGFTPWVDRSAGYYAILGMYGPNAVGNIGAFSVRTVQSLQPEIRRALAQ